MALIDESKPSSDGPAQVLLFGANSMLGWSILSLGSIDGLVAYCNGHTRSPPAAITRRVQLNDEAAVRELFELERPRLILAFAGICNVEKCETSPEFAESVNIGGARNLVAYAPPEARIVYGSSDHVFGGRERAYDEDSAPEPISVYGRTRVAAEEIMLTRPRTLILRPGLWVGPSWNGRIGHLDWLRYRQSRGLPMTVVADELRSAMWAVDAAQRVVEFARSEATGIRHLTATRAVARPELAEYLNRRFAIGATMDVETRSDRRAPHLGRVELATRYADTLASPLPSVVADEPGADRAAG